MRLVGFTHRRLYGRLASKSVLNDRTSTINGAYTIGSGGDACTCWGSSNGTSIDNLFGVPTGKGMNRTSGMVSGGTPLVWLAFITRVSDSCSRQTSVRDTSAGSEQGVDRNMVVALNR
jgi:hypothetical protein